MLIKWLRMSLKSARGLFQQKRQAVNCTLKRYEWEALAQLLHQGYPFREAYEMLQGNQRLFYAMEQGKPLSNTATACKRKAFDVMSKPCISCGRINDVNIVSVKNDIRNLLIIPNLCVTAYRQEMLSAFCLS